MRDDDARNTYWVRPLRCISAIISEWKLSDWSSISGGTVAGFRVYLHRDAEFRGVNVNFTGVIYGPAARKVDVEKATLRGAVITTGEVNLKQETAITYTEEDQRSVSATIITPW